MKGFFEDWDGEIVLSDVRNFKDSKDFLEKATAYVEETRGENFPLSEPTTVDIVCGDEEWMNADVAENDGFKGEKITAYVSDISWEKE